MTAQITEFALCVIACVTAVLLVYITSSITVDYVRNRLKRGGGRNNTISGMENHVETKWRKK